MVSTRASSSRAGSAVPDTPTPATPSSPSRTKRSAVARASSSSASSNVGTFSHEPTNWTMLWMAIAIPLVTWDTVYVLGRPHTMEGGWLHYPFWAPYKLYGEVDHVYGWKSFNANNGFTSAQGALNVVETLMYIFYVVTFFSRAADKKAVSSRTAAFATLIGFSSAVMTLSKTVLYCMYLLFSTARAQWRFGKMLTHKFLLLGLNEYYSGFDNIGHNDLYSLIFLWIIPKYVY